MTQVKVQFYTDEITVAVVDDMIDRYKESAKKTEVYSRLMLLGVQVVNDLGIDLSDEGECAALGLEMLRVDDTNYSKADAASDRVLLIAEARKSVHEDGVSW